MFLQETFKWTSESKTHKKKMMHNLLYEILYDEICQKQQQQITCSHCYNNNPTNGMSYILLKKKKTHFFLLLVFRLSLSFLHFLVSFRLFFKLMTQLQRSNYLEVCVCLQFFKRNNFEKPFFFFSCWFFHFLQNIKIYI